MNRRPTVPFAVALALLLTARPAPADQITWSEQWVLSPGTVNVNAAGTSGIVLTGGGAPHLAGSSSVVAANLTTFSDAPADDPVRFREAPFGLILTIHDDRYNLDGAVTFTGFFKGVLSSQSAAIRYDLTSARTQVLHLGHDVYEVTLTDYTRPGPPGSGGAGAFSAFVRVHHNPEPSGLVLAALALPLVGLPLRRRRRAA